MTEVFDKYIADIQTNLDAGNATEHTHRPALQALIESINGGVKATNEPQRIACGAPDFIIEENTCPIGFIECKDIGASLNAAEKSEQLKKYLQSLTNFILTDYIEFRYYTVGELRRRASLGEIDADGKIRKSQEGVREVSNIINLFRKGRR